MNAAFLLVTTAWLSGADPAPAAKPVPVAPGAVHAAPLSSTVAPGAVHAAPLASTVIPGACNGGGCGGCAGGDCGACCETSCGCGGGGGLFSRLRGHFNRGGCCDTCASTTTSCCETSCGCGGGGHHLFGRRRGGHGGGSCCDTCGGCGATTTSCCDDGCGCGGGGGGHRLFGRWRNRGGSACCDTGCDGCGSGCGSGAVYGGAHGAPIYGGAHGAPIYGGTAVPGGTMPPAGEPIKLPKDATRSPAQKLPAGKESRLNQPALDVTPTSSKTVETEIKNPFELDRRYEKRVDRAADYSWLTGQLFFVHADGGLWVLRYAPLGKEDPNGGSVILARDLPMDSYREGDLVTVHGEVLQQKGSARLGGPLYRATSIQLVDRRPQP